VGICLPFLIDSQRGLLCDSVSLWRIAFFSTLLESGVESPVTRATLDSRLQTHCCSFAIPELTQQNNNAPLKD
jgi:hypothetical protein